MMIDAFAPHVGEVYAAATEPTAPAVAALTLAEVQRPAGATGERPFSLIFEGADDALLDQAVYWLSPTGGEPQAIFLVPIAPRRYEAVFN